MAKIQDKFTGGRSLYDFSYDHIDRDSLVVKVNGVETSNFTWQGFEGITIQDSTVEADEIVLEADSSSNWETLKETANKDIVEVLPSGWVRPKDWLPIRHLVQEGDQKIVMLVAVYPHGSNFVAFRHNGDVAGYQIDWGDGSTVDVQANNSKAQKNLDWGDYPASSITSGGFKQAIITVTPQAGGTLVSGFLSEQHTDVTSSYSCQTLDVVAAGEHFDSITFNGAAPSASLESFEFIGECNINSVSNCFKSCYGLMNVQGMENADLTYSTATFQNCGSFLKQPALDFKNNINLNSIYYSNTALKDIYLENIGECVTIQYAAFNNFRLKTFRAFNTSKVASMHSVARICRSLEIFTLDDASLITTTTDAFLDANSLALVELPNLTVGISLENCKMSAQALNDFMTGIGTANGEQTLTFTGNWGASTCDPSIATAKGWTVITA